MKKQEYKRICVLLTSNDIAKVKQYMAINLKTYPIKGFSKAIRDLIDIGMKKVLKVD
jgi:hypothetical protein